jgi:Zn-dependent protease with chaperone function
MKACSALTRTTALVLSVLLALPGAAVEKQTGAVSFPSPGGFNLFSREQDVQLGLQATQEINKQMPLLPDSSPVTQYVQRLGRKLAAQLPENPYQFSFHVVQEKDINAFALPGGPVYVNLGTIEAADNEAQLAGVLAHEISHVYMRHSTKQASKQVLAQVPLAVVGGMLGGGLMGQLAQLGIGFGVGSIFLKYSRDAESQADDVGARIMYKAGYNPVEMANFFEKLEQKGGQRGPQFLSDHPNPGNREAAIRKEIATFPRRSYQDNNAEFARIRREAEGIKAYTAQEIAQGAFKQQGGQAEQSGAAMQPPVRADVMPSGSFRTLRHSAFTVTYPDNWQVSGSTTSAVTIAPAAGVTQGAIAYGVIINGFTPERSASLDDATHELINSLRQSNPEMRAIGQGENIRVNGVPGKSVDLIGSSPLAEQGRALRERDWLVTLQARNGSVIYLVFISPDKDFPQLRPTFEQILRTFHLR